jgi:hypothetical protein
LLTLVLSPLNCCCCQVSLEALRWVVLHSLTPLNYVLALEASVWFIERAALEHPKLKVRVPLSGCRLPYHIICVTQSL